MLRAQALPYVAYVVDDSGAGRSIGEDRFASVRHGTNHRYASRLVGWNIGSQPLFVAVHSYLDVAVGDDEAEEIAKEYLTEIGWFADLDGDNDCDYIL